LLDSFLTIANHPLLWIFIGLTVVFYGVQGLVNPGPDHQHRSFDTTGWLRRNYVAIVFALGGAAIVLALVFYVFEVGIAVARLVDRLRLGAAGDLTETEAKDLAYGIAVLLGAMVAAATIPFTLLRTWINERTATATEEGLITDRINKAVEGLGAEKTVRLHRKDSNGNFLFHEKEGSQGDTKSDLDFKRPVIVELTEPNLEVRIGAIYALERISQDSARDHIQIMEILCAYIRQNAPAHFARPFDIDDLIKPERRNKLPGGSTPRVDIQAAVSVIARRDKKRVEQERERGYRIDLRGCNLQNVDFESGNWGEAVFDGSALDQANLEASQFERASFSNCSFENGYFKESSLNHASAVGAQFRFIGISQKAGNLEILNSMDTLAAIFDRCEFGSITEPIIIDNQFHAAVVENSTFSFCQFRQSWFFQDGLFGDLESCHFYGCALRAYGPVTELFRSFDLVFCHKGETSWHRTKPGNSVQRQCG